MERNTAETIGIKALGWLVANDELLPVFLGSTGGDIGSLRDGANDPAFLGAVLDFLSMDDAWIVAFCDAEGLKYDLPLRARQVLAGPAEMHWT